MLIKKRERDRVLFYYIYILHDIYNSIMFFSFLFISTSFFVFTILVLKIMHHHHISFCFVSFFYLFLVVINLNFIKIEIINHPMIKYFIKYLYYIPLSSNFLFVFFFQIKSNKLKLNKFFYIRSSFQMKLFIIFYKYMNNNNNIRVRVFSSFIFFNLV
jgi:hypothetical protein